MQKLFNSIVDKGSKDNTYKFALTKFLLDYASNNKVSGVQKILYSEIAEKFLEYYWFQECKYKLKQDFKIERMPMIIRIIRKYCGEVYISESYEKYFKDKKNIQHLMILEIEKECLRDVVPRLQPRGSDDLYRHFHTINATGKKYKLPLKEKRYIFLQEEAHQFLKNNYTDLSKILVYEWAKFLEKINFTPRLISKIEDLGHINRRSLAKYKNILLRQMKSQCFYCNESIENTDIHIDHFIPWSYVYEDSIWNLVISCSRCNIKKRDYLAPIHCVKKIQARNQQYSFDTYDIDIMKYYDNCYKAGFLAIDSIECV